MITILRTKNAIDSPSKHSKYIFMIMPNVRGTFNDTIRVFDIKGHTDGRSKDIEDFKNFRFGKDENYLQSEEIEILRNLENKHKEKFLTSVKDGVDFLIEQ